MYKYSIIRDLCTRERYIPASSFSGTYIYQILKGMVLNVVLKSTREKQAEKVTQKSCCTKHALLVCWYLVTLIHSARAVVTAFAAVL